MVGLGPSVSSVWTLARMPANGRKISLPGGLMQDLHCNEIDSEYSVTLVLGYIKIGRGKGGQKSEIEGG